MSPSEGRIVDEAGLAYKETFSDCFSRTEVRAEAEARGGTGLDTNKDAAALDRSRARETLENVSEAECPDASEPDSGSEAARTTDLLPALEPCRED